MSAVYVEEQDGLIRAEITVPALHSVFAVDVAKRQVKADGYRVVGFRSVKQMGRTEAWLVTLGVRRRMP